MDFETHASSRIKRYLENIASIGESGQAGSETAKKRREQLATGSSANVHEDLGAFEHSVVEEDNAEAEEELLAPGLPGNENYLTADERLQALRLHLQKCKLQRPTTGVKDRSGILLRLSKAMTNCRMFESKLGRAPNGVARTLAQRFLRQSSDETESVVKDASKRLDDRKKAFLEELTRRANTDKDTDNDQSLAQAVAPVQAAQQRPILTVDALCDLVCKQDGKELSAEQRLAFLIIGDALITQHLNPTSEAPKQLRMFVGGPGGTGKTFLIKKLQAMCGYFGHRNGC